MLDIKKISKTFNPGTVNEKKALTVRANRPSSTPSRAAFMSTRAAFRSPGRTLPSCPSTSAPAVSGGFFKTPCAALRQT